MPKKLKYQHYVTENDNVALDIMHHVIMFCT